jgi:hypothetical protein
MLRFRRSGGKLGLPETRRTDGRLLAGGDGGKDSQDCRAGMVSNCAGAGRTMIRWLWSLALCLLLNACADPGRKVGETEIPTVSPEPSPVHKAGDVVQFDNWTVSVLRVESDWSSGNEFEQPEPGQRLVAIEFEVTNKGDRVDSTVMGTIFCHLRHSSGAEYGATFFGPTPALETENIPPGETRTGWASFEVPQDETDLLLVCEPGPFTRIAWDLNL